MREVLMIYLGGVILLLAVSTMINDEEKIGLDHILIAGFGWPILTPLLALRAWHSRLGQAALRKGEQRRPAGPD